MALLVSHVRPCCMDTAVGSSFNTLGDSINFTNISIFNGLAYPCTNVTLEGKLAAFDREVALSRGRGSAVWTDLTMMRPRANATKDPKFLSVFSQRSAMRLKRLSLPTRCSMRARAR